MGRMEVEGRWRWTVAVLGLAMAVGCGDSEPDGGGGGGGADAGTAGGGDAGGGPSRPTVSVSPSEGARGVLVESPLVLSFSAPMDRTSVENGWSSTSLMRGAMRFSWNTESTILTVDASQALSYPKGGPSVDRFGFDIVIDADAKSAAGVELGTAFRSSFETAREVTMTLDTPVALKTGAFDSRVSTSVLRVGDGPMNQTWRSYVTFGLDGLPPAIVRTESATLRLVQASIEGTPYADLGGLTVGRVEPSPSLEDAVSYASTAQDPRPLPRDPGVGDPAGARMIDVKAHLEAAITASAAELSGRFEFATAQDGDNADDVVILSMPTLELVVLAE
jgi:hypothetical protein